jgi:FlaA1/EpsC-like NDP-sugar epimerase
MGLTRRLHLRNRYFVASDVVFLPVAALLSFALRLDGLDLTYYRQGFVLFTVLSVLIMPLVFHQAGIYSRHWRYASVEELQLLVVAVTASVIAITGAAYAGLYFLPGKPVLPRSIPFIFLLLALAATAAPRLAVRLGAGHLQQRGRDRATSAVRGTALVFGAGDAGALIVRELKLNPQVGLEVVGFIDDDPGKRKMRIRGVPVLGSRHDIPRLVEQFGVGHIVIAMPTAPGKTIRELVAICEQVGVQPKIMPGMYELLDGSVSVNQLRDVEIEDLLRREPVRTDSAAVGELVRGKRVLVTGGGGSIGGELCRQLLRHGPAEIIVIGHGENSVFQIHNELRTHASAGLARPRPDDGRPPVAASERHPRPTAVSAVIADIRFADRIRAVFEDRRPEIVFHAAAHKHVGLMELNPAEAITNNVIGTKNLLDAAVAVGVERFVMISTDKAVNPTSIMGASKRVAELLVHRTARQSGRGYVAVRFGNVLGSRGSVVPIFKQQIAAGGPVTVTHPEMVRYFMTIPEAVQLVLQAAVLGRGGEVFVLDMGEPVKIVDLARDLIELSGLEVGEDIEIVFSGAQTGEKLFEELFVPGESYGRTEHQKVFIAANASRFVPLRLDEAVAGLEEAARRDDRAAIFDGLRSLIPEFQSVEQAEVADERQAKLRQPL